MAGQGFEGDVGYVAAQMRQIASHGRDIARSLERSTGVFVNFERSINRADAKMADIGRRMERLNELGNRDAFDKLRKSMRSLAGERSLLRSLDNLTKGVDKAFSSFAKLGGGVISATFGFLIDSIKRVYELQERWTRAIGGFNMRIGGLTSGLKLAQRAATQWSSTIRGLTGGDIFEGIQMFEDFTLAMSRTVKQGDQFSRMGIQLARGFNLGGQGAGKLARTFEDMGATAGDAASTMSELVQAANLVGVPVNQLSADVVEANTYMARFGKEGAKGFVTAAAYGRRFAMSMRELQAATEKFDLFDDAATSASKLNSTFGTLINSVDLMLMDDPAQRIEYLRQQFLAQGRTFDTLSIKERRFAAETMGVNEQQLAALLNLKNANESYLDLTAKQRSTELSEAKAKKQMEVQLRKTAQTMYAFGSAFDRITVAIAKAIRPLLEVLGLAKSGGKDFKSFGQVMEGITQHVIHFFESLAGNDKWQMLMRKLASGMREIGSAVGNFITSGKAASLAGEFAGAMADVYDWSRKALTFIIDAAKRLEGPLRFVLNHVKEIAVAWAAWQGIKMGASVAMKVRQVGQYIPKWNPEVVGRGVGGSMGGSSVASAAGGGGIDWGSAVGSPFGEERELEQLKKSMPRRRGRMSLGRAGAIGMAGAAAGIGTSLLGGSTGEALGSGIGTAGGTALGMVLGGPVGAAIGGAIGEFAGKRLGGAIHDLFKPGESALDKSRRQLQEAMDESVASHRHHASVLGLVSEQMEMADAKRAAMTARLNTLDSEARRTKGALNALESKEQADLIERLIDLKKMGMSSRELDQVFSQSLAPGAKLTDRQIRRVRDASKEYESTLALLREETKKRFEQERQQLEMSGLSVKRKQLGIETKGLEISLDQEKKRLKALESGQIVEDLTRSGGSKDQRGEFADFLSKGSRRERFDRIPKEREWLIKEFSLQKQRNKVKDIEMALNDKKEQAIQAGMDLDKRMFLLESRHLIMQDTRYAEFQRSMHAGGQTDENAIFAQYLAKNSKQYKELYGSDYAGLITAKPTAMASGGIVRRPTYAMIGESGPEAVVPLGRPSGRAIAQNMAAAAGGTSAGGRSELHVVTSDVHIDGTKVGRAITRVAITSPGA